MERKAGGTKNARRMQEWEEGGGSDGERRVERGMRKEKVKKW